MQEKYYFNNFPTLEDQRLILKEIIDDDIPNLMDLVAYDGFFPKTSEDVQVILEKIRNDYTNGDSILWGIFLKSTSELVGTAGFSRGYKNNIGEIGYVLKEQFRGQHIMTEAASLICDYGLIEMGLSKVIAYTDPDNTGSQAVLLRTGFTQVAKTDDACTFEITKK